MLSISVPQYLIRGIPRIAVVLLLSFILFCSVWQISSAQENQPLIFSEPPAVLQTQAVQNIQTEEEWREFLGSLSEEDILEVENFLSSMTQVSLAETEDKKLVANLNIHNAQIVDQIGHGINLTFELNNYDYIQPQVRYAVELMQVGPEGEQTLVDRKIYEETVSVAAGSPHYVAVTYEAPSYLMGEYQLFVVAANNSGLTLGIASLGTIVLTGDSQYVEILPGSCAPVKDVFAFGSGEMMEVSCVATNYTESPQTVFPKFNTHRYGVWGEEVLPEQIDVKPVTVPSGETVELTYSFPTATIPGTYSVNLSLGDERGIPIGNTEVVSYTVNTIYGNSASIRNVRLDSNEYTQGDIATAYVFWLPSGGLQTDDVVTVALTLQDETGNACADLVFVPVTGGEVTFSVEMEITRGCVSPFVTATLTGPEADVMDSQMYQLKTSDVTDMPSAVVPSATFSDWIEKLLPILIVLLVLMIIIAILFARFLSRRRSSATEDIDDATPPSTMLGLFLAVLVFAGVFGSSAQEVNAGTWVTTYGANTVTYTVNFMESSYQESELVTVSWRAEATCASCTLNLYTIRNGTNFYVMLPGTAISGSRVYSGTGNVGPAKLVTFLGPVYNCANTEIWWTGGLFNVGTPSSYVDPNPLCYAGMHDGLRCMHGMRIPIACPSLYSCTGSIPSYASAWSANESTGLTANTPWTYSSTDTATKCQYRCNSGYTWNGSSCVVVVPSATLSGTGCTIPAGSSMCNGSFTWSIQNSSSPNLFNNTRNVQYTTNPSGSGVGYAIQYGSNTVSARNGTTALWSITVTASCAAGTSWNGSICAAALAPSGSINATACTIPVGGTSCASTVSWSSANFAGTQSVRQGVTQFSTLTSSAGVSRNVNPSNRSFSLVDTGSSFSATVNATVGCAAGSSWNGSSCVATVAPSGSINATACTIPVGGTSCASTVSWSSANFAGTQSVRQGVTQFSTLTSSAGVSRNVNPSNRSFSLVDTGSSFSATVNATVGCAAGSSWNGSSCVATVAPSGSINATACTIPVGGTSCASTVSWSSANFAGTQSVRQGVTQFSTLTSSAGVSRNVNPSNRSFSLVDTGSSFSATVNATVGCAAGSSWNGSSCVAIVTYSLTVNSSGAAVVAITANNATYNGTTNYTHSGIISGTSITLTAPATASGNNFTSWTGCASASGNNCTVSMNANLTVTANYAAPRLTITKTGVAALAGTVTGPGINCGLDCTEDYTVGTPVTLTGTITNGNVNFSGACTGTTCNLTMDANRSVTATFSCDTAGGYVWNTTLNSCALPPGVCGSADSQVFATAPSGGILCAVGAPIWDDNTGATDGTYNWRCDGTPEAICSAAREPVINIAATPDLIRRSQQAEVEVTITATWPVSCFLYNAVSTATPTAIPHDGTNSPNTTQVTTRQLSATQIVTLVCSYPPPFGGLPPLMTEERIEVIPSLQEI
jgi:hypothetical protein